MTKEKQELSEFAENEKTLDRERKIMLLGIIKGMQMEAVLQLNKQPA